KQANIDAALAGIDAAAGTGARLVVLPEVWTYLGADTGNAAAAELIPGPLTDLLAERARRHGIFLHAGTMLERVEGQRHLHNTAVVFDPNGEIVARYRKIHLFDVDIDTASYRESDTIAPGDEVVTFELDGVTVGLATCYDVRFPELFRILALRGAEIILLPAAFTLTTGKDHWETLIRARAIENGIFMVATAQVGVHPPGLWCYGRSMVVDPWGLVIAQAADRPSVLTTAIELDEVERVRRQIPSLANRKPDRYRWPDDVLVVAGND
ncbi:MAG TPA: carbon-nitrogen hydrolase family protein, partial [Thermomicrobiales bacterium]|nr:carbon-nitrogen hydrolase family protein [Thermomicrobiales bacterium]